VQTLVTGIVSGTPSRSTRCRVAALRRKAAGTDHTGEWLSPVSSSLLQVTLAMHARRFVAMHVEREAGPAYALVGRGRIRGLQVGK